MCTYFVHRVIAEGFSNPLRSDCASHHQSVSPYGFACTSKLYTHLMVVEFQCLPKYLCADLCALVLLCLLDRSVCAKIHLFAWCFTSYRYLNPSVRFLRRINNLRSPLCTFSWCCRSTRNDDALYVTGCVTLMLTCVHEIETPVWYNFFLSKLFRIKIFMLRPTLLQPTNNEFYSWLSLRVTKNSTKTSSSLKIFQ